MEMVVKTVKGQQEVKGRGGASGSTGSSFPTAGIMGERRSLAPFLHGLFGSVPHGDGIHGGGKNVAFGGCNSRVEASPTI
jgi:hypothetical protein